jgi:hypothetical protein
MITMELFMLVCSGIRALSDSTKTIQVQLPLETGELVMSEIPW